MRGGRRAWRGGDGRNQPGPAANPPDARGRRRQRAREARAARPEAAGPRLVAPDPRPAARPPPSRPSRGPDRPTPAHPASQDKLPRGSKQTPPARRVNGSYRPGGRTEGFDRRPWPRPPAGRPHTPPGTPRQGTVAQPRPARLRLRLRPQRRDGVRRTWVPRRVSVPLRPAASPLPTTTRGEVGERSKTIRPNWDVDPQL